VAGADFCGNCGVKLIKPPAVPYPVASPQPISDIQAVAPNNATPAPAPTFSTSPSPQPSPLATTAPSPVSSGQFPSADAQTPAPQVAAQPSQPNFASPAAVSPSPVGSPATGSAGLTPQQPFTPQQPHAQQMSYQPQVYPSAPQPHQQPGMPMQVMPGHGYAIPRHPSNGLSVASMVTGIVSIVLSWTVIFSIPLGILAVIFGFVGKGKGGKGMAIAGIITGAIGLLLTVIILIAAFSSGQSDVDIDTNSSSGVSESEITRDAPRFLYVVPDQIIELVH